MSTTTVYLTASQVTQAVTDTRKAYARLRYFDTHPAYRNGAARERDVAFYDAQVSANDILLIKGGHKALVGNLVQEHVLQTRLNEAKRGIVHPGVPVRPELQQRLNAERKAIRETLANLPDDDEPCICGDYDHDTAHHTDVAGPPTLTVTPEAQVIIDSLAAEIEADRAASTSAPAPAPAEDGTACVLFFTAYLRVADVDRFKRYIYDSHTLVTEITFGQDSYGQTIAALVYKTVGRDFDQTSYLQQYQADRLASGLLGAVIGHVSQARAEEFITTEFRNNGGDPEPALRLLQKADTMPRGEGSLSVTASSAGVSAKVYTA